MEKNNFKNIDLTTVEQYNDSQSVVSKKCIKRLQDTAEDMLSLIEELKNINKHEVWRIDINDRLKQISKDLNINRNKIKDFITESKTV